MAVISKASLARELGVSRTRVSQLVKSGMPVRPDGSIDREDALEYLRLYKTSKPGSSKGAVRAKMLLASGPQDYVQPESELQPDYITKRWSVVDRTTVEALKDFVVKSRPAIARAAIEAGSSIKLAYLITSVLQDDLLSLADRLLEEREVPGWRGSTLFGLRLRSRGPEPRWEAFAAEIGETFDRNAVEQARESLTFDRLPLDLD